MLFNSFEFVLFFLIVFSTYWFVLKDNVKGQNILLLAASYFFYGWWDWRFLGLIAFSSLLDYLIGLGILSSKNLFTKKIYLGISLTCNLGLLGVFKYYNFFIESFTELLGTIGYSGQSDLTLSLILPVGISFYTFQTLSYTIDVYKGRLEPTKSLLEFFTFVSFFPQLVAGPIERAKNLLPQFSQKRSISFEDGRFGLRMILWGLFKKVVIADTMANYVVEIFNNYETLPGSTLYLGLVFFAFQIYCDFSGYSDMAIGLSKLFGLDLMRNFAYPFFSRDIAEFWRKWHISLTTWFKDYLYIPLGGSRGGTWMNMRNVFIIFLVSGFWHGANWTFVFWGFLNALYFLPLILTGVHRKHMGPIANGRLWPSMSEIVLITLTFVLTTFTWLFFRAESMGQAWSYLGHLFSLSMFSLPDLYFLAPLPILILFQMLEWWKREKICALDLDEIPPLYRRSIYLIVFMLIVFYVSNDKIDFIYFQF